MHDLSARYALALKHVTAIMGCRAVHSGCFRPSLRTPLMSDLEVMALSLAAESCGAVSENHLFMELHRGAGLRGIPLISRSRFNRRRRALKGLLLEFAELAGAQASPDEQRHLVDSVPLPVVRLARSGRCRICRQDRATLPAKGWSAVDARHFMGYKLHLVTTAKGVFRHLDITPGNVHDIRFIKAFNKGNPSTGRELVADRAYLSVPVQTSLFEEHTIRLTVPYRKGGHGPKVIDPDAALARRRIETVFSQLCDQFRLKVNYAQSYLGLVTRVVSKVAAMTMLQLDNALNKRPLGQIKNVAWGQ